MYFVRTDLYKILLLVKFLCSIGSKRFVSFSSWQERRRSQVDRVACSWCRKSPVGRELRLGFAIRRQENSVCKPSSKWIPFSNQGKKRQRKKRDWLRLSFTVPMIQWDSKPTVPTAICI